MRHERQSQPQRNPQMNQLVAQNEREVVPGSFGRPVPNNPGELARVPIGEPLKTLEEVVLFARALAFAGLLPDSLMDKRTQTVKVADVVLLLCMGAELELSPMQSIHASGSSVTSSTSAWSTCRPAGCCPPLPPSSAGTTPPRSR
jgi:hypothetical protein